MYTRLHFPIVILKKKKKEKKGKAIPVAGRGVP
jgi:hypothetical protein